MTDTVSKTKFDAVLQKLIAAKPQTEAETRAKAAAQRKKNTGKPK